MRWANAFFQMLPYNFEAFVAMLAGAVVSSGMIGFDQPQAFAIFLGIGVTAALDLAWRRRNRDYARPFFDSDAGGNILAVPLWLCCIAMSVFIAALYLGLLDSTPK